MVVGTRALGVFEVLFVCPTGTAEEEYGSLRSGNPVPVGFEAIASEIGVWYQTVTVDYIH
jgi:hypothetical protein